MEDVRLIRKGWYENTQIGYRAKGWGVASWEKVKRKWTKKKGVGRLFQERGANGWRQRESEREGGRERDRGQARHESS